MEVVVPVEMEVPTLRIEAFDKDLNKEGIMNSLNLVEEYKEIACLRVVQHQSRAARYYNSLVMPRRFGV